MDNKWMSVRNGTDIRGVVVENNERDINLTEDMVSVIAKAFAVILSKKRNKALKDLKISIGMDSRITSSTLKRILISEIRSLGCNVIDCGLCSTPAMFMSTVTKGYCFDGAVEITASHLPYYYNGFKFFTCSGGFESSDITELLDIACKGRFPESEQEGNITYTDFMEIYSNILLNKIVDGINNAKSRIKPLEGLKIIVDAGNGVGGFFVEKILKRLGADTTGSQFLEPDGTFPNHIPNPENKEAMKSIRQAVIKNNADLGIIFDTDVDRAAIVDENGQEINKNPLIALATAIVLEEYPNSTIVTDSVTSSGLKKFIEKRGGIHHRFKRGYKNIINEAINLNQQGKECQFAIETSGHAAFKENYFLDDGAYLVSKILIKMAQLKNEGGKKLGDLIADLELPYESVEHRIKIDYGQFKDYGISVLHDLEKYMKNVEEWYMEPNNHEGIRINCDGEGGSSWAMLRLSLHEAVMALNIESDKAGGVDAIEVRLLEFFKKYEKLDYSILNKAYVQK